GMYDEEVFDKARPSWGRRLTVNELIESLRAVKWEVTDDCSRMPDDPTHECVFVDMRPEDFRALLREAADALEAAREDAERYRHLFDCPEPFCYRGDVFDSKQEADAAIDQARGKGGRVMAWYTTADA